MSAKQQIEAAGAVLYRKNGDLTEIAVIFRRNTWDLPKGKMEEDELPVVCAKRELEEELGITEVTIGTELIQTYHEYEMDGIHFGKTTYWFVATAPEQPFIPQHDEDIQQVEWVSPEQALSIVGFVNLKRVIETFLRWQLRQKYAD